MLPINDNACTVAVSMWNLGLSEGRNWAARMFVRPFELSALAVFSIGITIAIAGCSVNSNHEDLCKTYTNNALQAVEAKQLDQAEIQFTAAIKEAEKSTNVLQLPTSLNDLGSLYVTETRYERAEQCYSRALEVYAQLLKNNDLSAASRRRLSQDDATTTAALAKLMVLDGKLDKAEQLYKAAVAKNAGALGSLDAQIQITNDYIALLRMRGKRAAADDLESSQQASMSAIGDWSTLFDRGKQQMSDQPPAARCTCRLRAARQTAAPP